MKNSPCAEYHTETCGHPAQTVPFLVWNLPCPKPFRVIFFYFEQIVLLFITNSIKKVFFSISNICLSNNSLSLCCWKMYLWISGKQASYLGNAPAPAYWKSGWFNGLGSGKRAYYWTTEHHFVNNCSIVLLLKMAVHVMLSPFILF